MIFIIPQLLQYYYMLCHIGINYLCGNFTMYNDNKRYQFIRTKEKYHHKRR
jgi:hypothetical protein